ncbi:MAG: O-antigen ligase family protein [Pseudomonadales bacterium]|nr:O-antigen ligase family protein [Pseudomonadales bacterium]
MNQSISRHSHTSATYGTLAPLPERRITQSLIVRFAVLGFLLLHIPLGIILKDARALSTVHAYIVIGIAIVLALSNFPVTWVAYSLAYIAGAEILWRMTKANVLWEWGKYATILIVIITAWRMRNFRIPQIPIIYILMLAPSSFMILMEKSLSAAQSDLSFNLSGPLALFGCVCLFSNLRFNQKQFQHLLIAVIAPTIAIGAIALRGIVINPDIVWVGDSNSASSGGFGPNQVSTALGLGLLCAWLIFFTIKKPVLPRFLVAGIAMWLATQTLLTFSRGGLLGALIGIGGCVGVALINRRITAKMIVLTLGAFALFMIVFYPQIDMFTDGALSGRYSNISIENTSGRDRIAEAELQVFLDNPFWGVGPGQAKHFTPHNLVAHTEYTRLLAEHGVFGILSLISLGLMGFLMYLKNLKNAVAQMIIVGALFWTLFYMMNVSMRAVAPAFMFGIIFAHFDLEHR